MRAIVFCLGIALAGPAHACDTETAVTAHMLGQIKKQCKQTHRLTTTGEKLWIVASLKLSEKEDSAKCLEDNQVTFLTRIIDDELRDALEKGDKKTIERKMCENSMTYLNAASVMIGSNDLLVEEK
jgi:hypothetical protein